MTEPERTLEDDINANLDITRSLINGLIKESREQFAEGQSFTQVMSDTMVGFHLADLDVPHLSFIAALLITEQAAAT